MAKENKGGRQVSPYDKILKENLEAFFPELLRDLLDINALRTSELPDNVQHTKERKPDVLKMITDDKGEIFVLHIEFQAQEEENMGLRMVEYWAMLFRKYRIPVRQYVIYIGEGVPTRMKDDIDFSPQIYFRYNLISLSTIDYHLLFRSDKPEVKLLSVLADLGKENPEEIIGAIAKQIIGLAPGDFAQNRYLQQLRIFAQFRNFITEILPSMDSIAKFIKEERDFLYIRGERKGLEKGREEGIEQGIEQGKETFIRNLLLNTDFTVAQIAALGDVPEAFVEKVKETLD